jgi:hypothetical protein
MSDVRDPPFITKALSFPLPQTHTETHGRRAFYNIFCVLLWILWRIIFTTNSVSWLIKLGASSASGGADL